MCEQGVPWEDCPCWGPVQGSLPRSQSTLAQNQKLLHADEQQRNLEMPGNSRVLPEAAHLLWSPLNTLQPEPPHSTLRDYGF